MLHTYKTLQAATGESMTNLRQLAHTGALPEPDGRIGISPYWNADNPGILAFLQERAPQNTGAEG